MPVTLQPPKDEDETYFIPFYNYVAYNYVAMLNVSVLKHCVEKYFWLYMLYLFFMQCFQNIHPMFWYLNSFPLSRRHFPFFEETEKPMTALSAKFG